MKLKANFSTPMASKANKKVSASVSDSGEGVKGEKVKEKVVDGAVGGCCGEKRSEDECVSARRSLTKEKLDNICHHLSDRRGECLFWCCC